MSRPRRELLSVRGVEPVGPYTLVRLERGGSRPGHPGQFFMLEAPGCLLPRPLSLCLAPSGELAFLIDPIGPGNASRSPSSRPGDRIHVFGPLGNGYRLDVPKPLLVGGGIGIAPLPYLSEALEHPPAVLGFRSEHHAEAAVLVPNAEVVIDPVLVTDGTARPAATSSRAGRSRCSRRSARTLPALSSPGRRRWRAATAAVTAASSRSTARSSGCASRGPSCAPERERLPRRADGTRCRRARSTRS